MGRTASRYSRTSCSTSRAPAWHAAWSDSCSARALSTSRCSVKAESSASRAWVLTLRVMPLCWAGESSGERKALRFDLLVMIAPSLHGGVFWAWSLSATAYHSPLPQTNPPAHSRFPAHAQPGSAEDHRDPQHQQG